MSSWRDKFNKEHCSPPNICKRHGKYKCHQEQINSIKDIVFIGTKFAVIKVV